MIFVYLRKLEPRLIILNSVPSHTQQAVSAHIIETAHIEIHLCFYELCVVTWT